MVITAVEPCKYNGHKLRKIMKRLKKSLGAKTKTTVLRTFDEIKGQQNDATNQYLDELQLQTNTARGSCVIYEF